MKEGSGTMFCDEVGRAINVSSYQNRTNFTSDQLITYADRYINFKCSDIYVNRLVLHTCSITGFIGLVAYFLMLASLNRTKTLLSGCTMIYHEAIILLELPHMVVMIESGLINIYASSIPISYSWLVWTRQFFDGWNLGDWTKLSVSTLTAFLTMERFVAVCIPTKFSYVDRNPIAYCAVIVSVLIGSAHMWAIFTTRIDFDDQLYQYNVTKTWFSETTFFDFTLDFIYCARIALCLIIFVLSVSIALTLAIQAKKVALMSSGAEQEWKAKLRVCLFSYIVGMCVLIDHLVWVVHKITADMFDDIDFDRAVTSGQSYEDGMEAISYRQLVVITGHIQAWMGQLVHGWRFFIYLACNQTMREGFKAVVSCQGRKTTVHTLHSGHVA